MLKKIPKIIVPKLLATLAQMGHGDEIVIADANFPGERLNVNTIRCDGIESCDMLEAILQLLPLDQGVDTPWIMMQPSDTNNYDLEEKYRMLIRKCEPNAGDVLKLDRLKFYERASSAFSVVMTGTAKRFGNIILKKGTLLE